MAVTLSFKDHWKKREGQKLAKELAWFATQEIAWRLEPGAQSFLRDERLMIHDLNHVVATAFNVVPGKQLEDRRCRPTGSSQSGIDLFVRGYTIDEVEAALTLRIYKDADSPSIVCFDGKLFCDKEGLTG